MPITSRCTSGDQRRQIFDLCAGLFQVSQTDGTHGDNGDSGGLQLFDPAVENFFGKLGRNGLRRSSAAMGEQPRISHVNTFDIQISQNFLGNIRQFQVPAVETGIVEGDPPAAVF